MEEVWKDIKGYEGYYQISNLGRVKSLSRIWIGKTKLGTDRPNRTKEKILKIAIEKGRKSNVKDSCYVVLRKDGRNKHHYVHRLVAGAFIKNDNTELYTQVNHKDGDRYNNCVENLEWVTPKQNIEHAFKNKLIKTQKPVAMMDIGTEEVLKIFEGESSACRYLGVTQGKVLRSIQRNGTCCGYKWQYINENL